MLTFSLYKSWFYRIIILVVVVGVLFFIIPQARAQTGIFVDGLSPTCIDKGICGACEILIVIGNFMRGIFAVIGVTAVLFLLISGMQYMLSVGNQERVGKAKEAFAGSLIGLVIIFVSFILIELIIVLLVGNTYIFDLTGIRWNFFGCILPPAT